MAEQAQEIEKSSYSKVLQRFNSLANMYSSLPTDSIYSAFSRAMGGYWANAPQIQNSRVKALSPLPADVSKNELTEFLRNPAQSELPLQRVAEGLKWGVYSFYKLQKSYSDMLTYKHYAIPEYITAEELKGDEFKREYRLVDKFIKAVNIPQIGHKLAGQALTQGKVFYVPRYRIDKSHNRVDTFFLQQLPTGGGWAQIIGLNNISKYTISFNLMYFYNLGTDFRQFGDLFDPYIIKGFDEWVTADNRKAFKGKYVYASRNNADRFEYEAKAWCQNGQWMYYVSLPIDKVWTFEIDDTTPIVASPLAGLMQTFAQQSDYEAAQLSLILNPLIKIFTGEIPYTKAENSTQEDGYRLSLGGLHYFVDLFEKLMLAHNTGGTAFYAAPVENLRSHDFPESANANSVSKSFLDYGMAKSGAQGVIPITDRPTEEMVKASEKLEPRFAQNIYRTLENMLNYILNNELSLRYQWRVHIFGDIYSDDTTRANCLKQLDKGDLSVFFQLCALDDESVLDKVVMSEVVKGVGLYDLLQPPKTAYTQSSKSQPQSDTGGAPEKSESDRIDTQIEKQTESATSV